MESPSKTFAKPDYVTHELLFSDEMDLAAFPSQQYAARRSKTVINPRLVKWNDFEVGDVMAENQRLGMVKAVVRIRGVDATKYGTINLRQICTALGVSGYRGPTKQQCLRLLASRIVSEPCNLKDIKRFTKEIPVKTKSQKVIKSHPGPSGTASVKQGAAGEGGSHSTNDTLANSGTDDSQIDGVPFDTDDEIVVAAYDISEEIMSALQGDGDRPASEKLGVSMSTHVKAKGVSGSVRPPSTSLLQMIAAKSWSLEPTAGQKMSTATRLPETDKGAVAVARSFNSWDENATSTALQKRVLRSGVVPDLKVTTSSRPLNIDEAKKFKENEDLNALNDPIDYTDDRILVLGTTEGVDGDGSLNDSSWQEGDSSSDDNDMDWGDKFSLSDEEDAVALTSTKKENVSANGSNRSFRAAKHSISNRTSSTDKKIGSGEHAKAFTRAQGSLPGLRTLDVVEDATKEEKSCAKSIFEGCSEHVFSAAAGRARLALPSTRSTDVPNGVNIESHQLRPYSMFTHPPVTLMSEIRPLKRRRVSCAHHLKATNKITCYDRKTCTVLQDVCEVKDLGNLLTGYAALEPLIPPPDLWHKQSTGEEIYALRGRSASNVCALSDIRAQNIRCSDIYVGKDVMVTSGLYKDRRGTITAALPWGGWYKVSGLRDDESDDEFRMLDLDILVKTSDLQFVHDTESEVREEHLNDVSCLRGMDPSALFLVK